MHIMFKDVKQGIKMNTFVRVLTNSSEVFENKAPKFKNKTIAIRIRY